MFACRRIVPSQFRRFHTRSVTLADSGIFGKFNPWAKESKTEEVVTPAQHTNEEVPVTFNVKYEDKVEIPSWKSNEIISDPEKIESTVQSIVLEHTTDVADWKKVSLNDSDLKFKIVKESMKQMGREIPSYQLSSIDTVQDMLDSFKESNEVRVEDMSIQDFLESSELPANLEFVPLEK